MCPSANFSHFLLIILALLKGFPYLKGIESANVVAENYSIRVASQSSARVLEDEKETRISEALNPVLVLDNTVNVRELLKEDPFSQWTYRSRWSELSDLELTSDSMSKAIQAGKASRLKRVLLKALAGKKINVVIVGGSNSAGGKLGVDEGSLDGLYFNVFTKWWNDTIAKATNAFVTEYGVTIGGTGSYVFAFCYKTFIPRDLDIDIVLIEASINFNIRGKAEPLEQLTRQVLSYPSVPAVFYINLVSGLGLDPTTQKVINPLCTNLENFRQTELAHHYGISSFSLKEVLCRKKDDGWEAAVTNLAGSDGRHIGIKAHAQVAIMIIEHVRGVFKEVINDVTNNVNANEIASLALPELFFLKSKTEALSDPLCWTWLTPDVYQSRQRSNLKLDVIESKGFYRKGGSKTGQYSDGNNKTDLRTDAQGGWTAWNEHSILKLRFLVPPLNSQTIPESRSVIVVAHTSGYGGKAKLWLDDNKAQAIYVDSKANFGNNLLNTVATRVDPGYHVVTVQTLRWGMFMVSGLFVGPPDFNRREVL